MKPTLSERFVDPPSGWPTATELAERAASADLLLLPEDTRDCAGSKVAPFRRYTQDLRVVARESGIRADLVVPDGTQVAAYSEHAAEWVLPVVFGIPASVVATLVANWLQARMDSRRPGAPMPTVRYREAELRGDQVRVREVEGPVDAVIAMLRNEERQSDALSTSGRSDRPPALPSEGE
jgi:hypothetical protein